MGGVVPYLIRAYCDWIEDSNLTPHILVNCEKTGVVVPEGLAKEGKIVLNIGLSATEGRLITNNSIAFKARFQRKASKNHRPLANQFSLFMLRKLEKACFLITSSRLKATKTKSPT